MNTKEGGEEIDKSVLIEAFRENLNHARHLEKHRIYSLYIHGAIIAGVIHILYYVRWNSPLGIFALAFLAFLSFVIYCVTLRSNSVIGSNLAAVRSISVKLGLVKDMEKSERDVLKRRLLKGRLRKISFLDPEYAFIKEAYIGGSLPLPIRARSFFEIYYLIVTEISLIFAIVAAYFFFTSIFAINHLKLVIVSIVLIVFIITHFVLWRIRRGMKYEARVFKDMREPKEKKRRIEEDD